MVRKHLETRDEPFTCNMEYLLALHSSCGRVPVLRFVVSLFLARQRLISSRIQILRAAFSLIMGTFVSLYLYLSPMGRLCGAQREPISTRALACGDDMKAARHPPHIQRSSAPGDAGMWGTYTFRCSWIGTTEGLERDPQTSRTAQVL